MTSKTTAAKKHVAEIRRMKFSIGGEPNPLTEDLHEAVRNLSAELYAKDVHFLMELIQNAEDNEYPTGVDPSLEFVITSKDITKTGAQVTLLVFNNEKGFSRKNIDSICSVGRSTKKGLRKSGYIGEKGIGFKSVFLITSQPYIFSNGYQIRFNEKPCELCNVGYIVPEWVEDKTTLSALKRIYGSTDLPTTTLILPLKSEKVKPVKDQLFNVHPEVLLFLSKINRFSVREVNDDLSIVNAISISSEKLFATSKSMDADSYTIHLTVDDKGNENDRECGYYMWKQRFPVKQENKVDIRREVEEWVITLAFPIGERLQRGKNMPGIYSFLPTETVTNFPFIIQADFLMASSRENILWDNIWNQGILDCVPVAFLKAFISLVKSTENAPVSSLPNMFRFLPIMYTPHPKLMSIQHTISTKLKQEAIIPCESYTGQKLFCKPNEVGRLYPAFWSILNKAKSQGVSLSNISSHGFYILSSSFDDKEYDAILKFMRIYLIDDKWYAKCIGGSDLVMGVSEDVYLQLLSFIASIWEVSFSITHVNDVPLIKYVGRDGNVDLFNIKECSNKLLVAINSDHNSWLIKCNTEFISSTGSFFLPKATQEALQSCSENNLLKNWFKETVKVNFVSVNDYAKYLSDSIITERKLAVIYAHFLYKSLQKKYLSDHEVKVLCSKMPIVDNYGRVNVERSGVLVPAKGSKWVEVIGSNPWRELKYVELGEDYTRGARNFCNTTSGDELIKFMKKYVNASDIPHLSPPNHAIPTLSSSLTKKNTFILLHWLNELRIQKVNLPELFLSSIKHSSWLKISLSGSSGYRPPSESFMLESENGHLLQYVSGLVDIPLVDEKFYGAEIKKYKDELKTIGVRFENKDACEFIGKHLMSLAASSNLTKDNVVSILKFIRYLGKNFITSEHFVKSIREGKWLRTSQGDMAPTNSVLFSNQWSAVSQICNIPFIDQDYYGNVFLSYKKELELLGVVVKFNPNCYRIVSDNLKISSSLDSLSSEAFILILKCIQKLESSTDKLEQAIKNSKCLKTNLGFRIPSECFFLKTQSEWCCLLDAFSSFPVVDKNFYGKSIFSVSEGLKKIGVKVDFEDAAKEFTCMFKQQASLFSITKENVFSFLECYKKLMKAKVKCPTELKNCVCKEKWIRTKLGDFRSPNECILFSNEWDPVSLVSQLPFIDDSDSFYGSEIQEYRTELKKLGVIIDFKDGAKFVASGIILPHDCSNIPPVTVYALLESLKKFKEKEKETEILGMFIENLSQTKWLKTSSGYKRPNECLLFHSAWEPFLKRKDGPFLDEEFYGSEIGSYEEELNDLGVVTDINNGCRLLAGYIKFQSSFEAIGRIYNYLSEFKWKPDDEDSKKIWISKGTNNGEWVDPLECVLHDKNNLFSGLLNVLEKSKYEKKILDFFANIFEVKVHPSVDDYCKLWKKWESSGHQITRKECCSFWEFVVINWNSKKEDTFDKNISKLPVLDPNSDEILLIDKHDVFIGDDLYLMDLFQKNSSRPIFVWFPRPPTKSLTRTKLLDIYTKLNVRTLSASAQKNVSDIDDVGFKPVISNEKIVKPSLFKLILGFLADSILKLDTEKRHESVSRILGIEAFETAEPMTIRYSLSFSSGDVVNVETQRMMRWDKQNSKLYMQKQKGKRCRPHKTEMEYAFHFAEVIADGVLWENEEFVPQLSELIRLGFLVDFDDDAVEFLMKTKNLEIFPEDEDFLSTTFFPDKSQPDQAGRVYKRRRK